MALRLGRLVIKDTQRKFAVKKSTSIGKGCIAEGPMDSSALQRNSCREGSQILLRQACSSPSALSGDRGVEERHDNEARLYSRRGGARHRRCVRLRGPRWSKSPPSKATPAVAIDNDDIGGVVTGAERAGGRRWVIAETTDLPTQFARIVVTDDQGRYLVPDLPKANYKRVGARLRSRRFGQGRRANPGRLLNLTAVPAPNEARGGAILSRRSTGIRC